MPFFEDETQSSGNISQLPSSSSDLYVSRARAECDDAPDRMLQIAFRTVIFYACVAELIVSIYFEV